MDDPWGTAVPEPTCYGSVGIDDEGTPVTGARKNRRVWIDLISPPDPPFFGSLGRGLDDAAVTTTARRKGRTLSLARELDLDHTVVGRDFDDPLIRKFDIPLRAAQLALRAPASDVSLSARNAMCLLASKVRGIPSIHFTDNDITAYVNGLRAEELYVALEATATHTVVPAAFATEELTDRGADPASIHIYDGYKEDVYVADFEADPRFTDCLPFESGYVVLRPEALTAAYVDAERSIVPELLALLVDRGIDVVYLPRGRDDEAYATSYPSDRVFVPDGALDGLQLAWHAQCVLSRVGMAGRAPDDHSWIGATRDGESVTGHCEYCEWDAVTDSYAAMVKAYQDHLREAHPYAWLRA